MCSFCEIIKSLDSYSVEYLGWITAIVGGIITITTIVFTHYNERSIEKSNDFVEEIMSRLENHKNDKENLPYKEVMGKFNKVINVLSNNHVYKTTLFFFEMIIYSLAILWIFGSLGYALNSKTWTEKILIMTASFILIGVFLFIPEIVKGINQNKSLMVTNKNKCSYNEGLKFFKKNNILVTKDIISNLISPVLNISINNDDHIVLEYNQGLAIVDYFIIFKLEKNNEVIYISLNIDSDKHSLKFSTNPNMNGTFRGLYDLIKTSSKTKGNVFIFDNITLDKSVYKLSNILNEDGDIVLGIKNNELRVTNIVADKIFDDRASKVKLINSSQEKDYSLTKLE